MDIKKFASDADLTPCPNCPDPGDMGCKTCYGAGYLNTFLQYLYRTAGVCHQINSDDVTVHCLSADDPYNGTLGMSVFSNDNSTGAEVEAYILQLADLASMKGMPGSALMLTPADRQRLASAILEIGLKGEFELIWDLDVAPESKVKHIKSFSRKKLLDFLVSYKIADIQDAVRQDAKAMAWVNLLRDTVKTARDFLTKTGDVGIYYAPDALKREVGFRVQSGQDKKFHMISITKLKGLPDNCPGTAPSDDGGLLEHLSKMLERLAREQDLPLDTVYLLPSKAD